MQTNEELAKSGLDRRWLTLIAVCGATFMLLVDITIVQVALPTIQRHLGASFTDLQWVIDAYALALATLILTWGSTADRFGRKRVFVVGLGVFTLASALCGVANSSVFLIWRERYKVSVGQRCLRPDLRSLARNSTDRNEEKPSPRGVPRSALQQRSVHLLVAV